MRDAQEIIDNYVTACSGGAVPGTPSPSPAR
jgi:hypothetical protein